MLKIKVIDHPVVTISGSSYTAAIPIEALDPDNGSTYSAHIVNDTIMVTGITSDTFAQFKSLVLAAINTWKTSFLLKQTLQAKLDTIVWQEV